MNGNRSDVDAQLEASLRRIADVLRQNRWPGPGGCPPMKPYSAIVGKIMADTGAEVVDRVTARIAEKHQRRIEKWSRHEQQRAERWAARQERRRDRPVDVSRGVVSVVAAVACAVIAIMNPELWWLVFVAFGFGTSAASTFGRAARQREAQRQPAPESTENGRAAEPARAEPVAVETEPAPPADPPDPKVVRIQTLCDKLLAELESGPQIVREVVAHPKETIGGLRQACLEIARRERELRAVLAAQEEATLIADRDALVTRLGVEQDEIVRDRLGQALRALEQQLAHRAELTTAAARLEAENTRILYTLESLHMQILRARSTDIGAPELGGKLRESLRELGTEIDAVADALEWASAPGGAHKTPAPVSTADTGPDADAQRAERQDAARRAAQARDAQRQ